MDLILWRHAEAFDTDATGNDLQRALTPKGQRQAQGMAQWLNARLADTTRILVSPALRCQQTAQALGKPFATLTELGPGAGAQAVLKAARWPGAGAAVLIVGHQPTLGLVAARLLADAQQAWAVKKGAVWWLRMRGSSAEVVLHAVQSPDSL
jgi:phosphohistidine phosphatase